MVDQITRLHLRKESTFIRKRGCKGVFGWPAIHTRTRLRWEEVPKLTNIFLLIVVVTPKAELERWAFM
jgi:hypothetical protein